MRANGAGFEKIEVQVPNIAYVSVNINSLLNIWVRLYLVYNRQKIVDEIPFRFRFEFTKCVSHLRLIASQQLLMLLDLIKREP